MALRPGILLTAVLSFAVASLAGCSSCVGGNDGGSNSVTTAHVDITVRGDSLGPGVGCGELRLVVELEPQALSGSEGRDTALTIDRTVDGFAQAGHCFYRLSGGITGLRTGAWKLSASTPAWSASCEENMTAGANMINFTLHRAGCVKGFGFPGD